ncbi:MAG: exopolysaccharide biosynthesis protein [Isosphaeraceae bacterium]
MKLPQPDARALIPTSVVLQRLHDEVPADHFTLGWLMGSLRRRSFGIIMLLLALVAMAPGVSIVAGLLLMIPAFQMIAGQPAPVFPRRIAVRPLPTRHLAARATSGASAEISREGDPSALAHPDRGDQAPCRHRRRDTEHHLGVHSEPLSNVVPALVIALISLAYLEEDGLLLSIALLAAIIVLGIELVAVWETVLGAKWIVGLW